MARYVVGLFDSRAEAEAAVRDLHDAGFDSKRISYLASNARGEYDSEGRLVTSDTTEIERGAGFGATSGALMGGAVGLLVGLGALVIPGIGPAIAAGSWATALAGTAVGAGFGATTGGMIGSLVGAGVVEEQAHVYAESVRRGSTLVAVELDAESEADRVAGLLRQNNAVDVERRGQELRESGWSRFAPEATDYSGPWYDRAE